MNWHGGFKNSYERSQIGWNRHQSISTKGSLKSFHILFTMFSWKKNKITISTTAAAAARNSVNLDANYSCKWSIKMIILNTKYFSLSAYLMLRIIIFSPSFMCNWCIFARKNDSVQICVHNLSKITTGRPSINNKNTVIMMQCFYNLMKPRNKWYNGENYSPNYIKQICYRHTDYDQQ